MAEMAEYDYLLAVDLQSEFDEEFISEHTVSEVDRSKRKRKSLISSKGDSVVSPAKQQKLSSLVDPEWEVIDPTPDIHSLFMSFSKRFFWNALGSVEVRWSRRMYSCAGICSYRPNSGLCSIGLSEPLLKLRPRSDLIETLLHEMIHAYLFVTHNDRDRDGHGPEFRKHMYRINQIAGTNITIYHSFNDEVKLYQKHWWRCDGPCKHRSPFFGTVRRSMNRAPGPNDFWWQGHQATCGGKFIKIRDPKDEAKPKKDAPKNPTDIRKFVKVSPKKTVFGINDLNAFIPLEKSKGPKNEWFKKFQDPSEIGTSYKNESPKNNIFSDSDKLSDNRTNNTNKFGSDSAVSSKGTPSVDNKFSPFTGKGHVLGTSNSRGGVSLSSRLTNSNSESGCRSKDNFCGSQSKVKLVPVEDINTVIQNKDDFVNCPVCDIKTHRDDMQIHLQFCDTLNATLESMNDSGTLEISDDEDTPDPLNDKNKQKQPGSDMLPCPCCSKPIMESDINKHLDECLSLLAIKEFEKDW